MADNKLTSQSDSKRHISYGSNPVTRTIKISHRIMIGSETVFRVTHINDFEYNSKHTGSDGLIKALVLSCSFIENDDIENRVAYNKVENIEDSESDFVKGDTEVFLGSTNLYSTENINCRFELSMANNKYNYAELILIDNYNCKVKVSHDSRFIGQVVTLKVYQFGTTNLYQSIDIKIVGI